MPRLEFLRRAIIATTLVALAVTLGVWMTRAPLTAIAAIPPAKILPEPTLAPPPPPPTCSAVTRTTIEVPVEIEIAALAPVGDDPPPASAVRPIEPKPEPQANCHRRRWGLFRRAVTGQETDEAHKYAHLRAQSAHQ